MTRRLTQIPAAQALQAGLLLLIGASCSQDGPPVLPSGPIRGAMLDSNPDGTLAPQVDSAVSREGADVLVAQAEPRETGAPGATGPEGITGEVTSEANPETTGEVIDPEIPSDLGAWLAGVPEPGHSIPMTEEERVAIYGVADLESPDANEAPTDEVDESVASEASNADAEKNAETAFDEPDPIAAESSGETLEEAPAADEPVSDELVEVNFDDLSDFDYEPPTIEEIESGVERPQQIPDEILALNGRKVEVEGYMIPMDVEDGEVLTFILSRTLAGCCFGDVPHLLEWIDVRMIEGETADYVPYAPVLVTGRLSVGESVDEYGITSVYRITAETVEDPW